MWCTTASLIAVALCAVGAQQLRAQTTSPNQLEVATPQEDSPLRSCLSELEPEMQRRGVSKGLIDQIDLSLDPYVLDAARSQAEFEKPIWAYMDAAVSEARISTGQSKLAEWAAVLAEIETRFG